MSENRNLLRELSQTHDELVREGIRINAEDLYIRKFQQAYWSGVYNAHANGKKVVLIGPGFPSELVYAFDAVPLLLDSIPIRLSTTPDTPNFIDLAEKYIPATVCAIDKGDLGVFLSGQVEKPDAFLYATGPCDSYRVVYPILDKILDVPSLCIDQPYRKDPRGYTYAAQQLRNAIPILEKVTGNKMDWDRMREVIRLSNQGAALLIALAELRKQAPCPLPGILLAVNELFGAMMGSQALVDFLAEQYMIGKAALEAGKRVTGGPEQHRILWLQNMMWSNIEILEWMEKELNAVVVMGTFEGYTSNIIEDVSTEDAIMYGLGIRSMGQPMVHAAGGSVVPWVELANEMVVDYKCNSAMFIGHVGCKHIWAAGKMIKDDLMSKQGIKTLTLDVDSVDTRYQKIEDVQVVIREFLETVEVLK